jgi:hypothetical protein
LNLDKLRQICAAATPGPWGWETSTRLYAEGNGYVIEDGNVDAMIKQDADFIAAFNPELVGKLLAALQAAETLAAAAYDLSREARDETDASTQHLRLHDACAAYYGASAALVAAP